MFRSLIPASAVLFAVLAACAGGSGATTAPTTGAASAAATTAASPSAAATLAFTVALAPGGFFVGPSGMTLYSFDNDAAGVSNCQSGQCHDNWPPLTAASAGTLPIGAGLNDSDFSTITWPDGTIQVTYKDVPLYYFAGDKAVGDKNGDGIGGVWHLATKATVPVAAPSPSAAPTAVPTASATAAASAAVSSVPSSGASAAASPCFDADGYEAPCPAGSPAATTVSISAAGNLVTATGISLYTFDKDTTANQSSCTGDCLTNWPALTIEGTTVTVGAGLDPADFTTFTRTDDATTQIAYYTKPLYMFAGDTTPGQTNGDGVAGIWHLAKPQ